MSTAPKKEYPYMNSSQSTETRISILEQALIHNTSMLHDIKNKIDDGRKENKEEFNKIWNKVENLDNRINDNYKYLDQKIDTRFADVERKISSNFKILLTTILGLYATAFASLIPKAFDFLKTLQ